MESSQPCPDVLGVLTSRFWVVCCSFERSEITINEKNNKFFVDGK